MEAKKLDISAVAENLGWSFEHIRKLYSSAAFPSRPLRDAIADLLEIDRAEFEKQVNADRWRAKFGKIPSMGQKQHPIYTLWEELSDDQQSSLLCIARCFARQKKRKSSSQAA